MLQKCLENLHIRWLLRWTRIVVLGLAIQTLPGSVLTVVAAGTPHQYDGKIQFDISKVPFSRYGSYVAFSHLKESSDSPEGLYLRILHGAIARRELFRVELLHGRNPIAFREIATPTVLRLEAAEGYAEICIAEPKVVLIRGDGVGFRLAMPQPEKAYSFAAVYNHAFPFSQTQWEVNSFTQQIRFMLTALDGNLVVDAPWRGTRSEHVVADFLPDPQTRKFQAALEEFTSGWKPRQYNGFDSSLQTLESEYRQWLTEMPAVPEEFSQAAELSAYVDWESVVAPEGHLTRPAMLMSKNWMTNIWSWDNCFNAMALFNSDPKLAMDQLRILFDNQNSQGAFPDYMNDQVVSWSYSKPPIHGWALQWMLAHSRSADRETLAEIYEPLVRWTNWYFNYRDYDHDGIPEYDHGNDSGWDNSTIFMIRPPIEAPDLSAYLVIQMDVLSEIARILERPDEAQSWKKRADDLLTKMLARCWKGDGFVAPQAGDHTAYPSQSLILYLPIVLGRRLPKPVLDQLVAGLKIKGRFLTENGLATESLQSPFYEPDGYWLGPIWAPSTMVIAESLDEVGEKEFANDLRLRFCKLVAKSGISENFDAITGVGLRDPAYTWTSSVFLIFAHELLEKQQTGSQGAESRR